MSNVSIIDPIALPSEVPSGHRRVLARDLIRAPRDIRVQLCEMSPDGGAEPHLHEDQDQMFLVIEGRLQVTDGDGRGVEVEAGQALSIPAGIEHGTTNDSDGVARYVVITCPRGSLA
jgi:mannose-6-phosphate isomerase-like protein (cupin superfamily)